MFSAIDGTGDVSILADGTECEKLGELQGVTVEGISMQFHKLDCDGQTGYVNVKWIQE